MKRRATALLCAIALLLCLLPGTSASNVGSGTQTLHLHRIVTAAESLFWRYEGNYDSVNADDNGALSIGKMQWHAERALALLKTIVAANPEQALELLGEALYEEIVSAGSYDWNERTVNEEEAAALSLLLATQQSIDAQDALAFNDVRTYIVHGWNAGIRTDAAILYYCSIENQYGYGGAAKVLRQIRETLGITEADTIDSLERFHQGALDTQTTTVQNYINARIKVYRYILGLGWDTTGQQPNCPGGVFSDMPDEAHWAHEGIDFCVRAGLFRGVSETSFLPEGGMTRAMVVTVLYRLSGSTDTAVSSGFSDVPQDAWYAAAVCWAAAHGIVRGYDTGEFRPEQPVTREQLATLLCRFAFGDGNAPVGGSLDAFADREQVSDYALGAMRWAIASGCLTGSAEAGELRLLPQAEATREQVAAILLRFCTSAQRGR